MEKSKEFIKVGRKKLFSVIMLKEKYLLMDSQ